MLKERQLNILGLVVQLFTTTGQPVGSATLKKLGVEASPATIRNDLATLEDLGFLEKTHVSSGRIPSNEGYRYYVDHLLNPTPLQDVEYRHLQQSFGDGFFEMDDLLQKSVSILSKLTNMTTFVLGPNHNDYILTDLKIMPISLRKAMVVLVTNDNDVDSQMIPLPEQLTNKDFEQIMNIVKERFIGESFITIYQRIRTELPITLQRYVTNPSLVISLLESILDNAFEDKVYVSGQMNLLDAINNDDTIKLKKLFRLLNDDHQLIDIVPTIDRNINVVIGDEINNDLLNDMTLITAKYQVSKVNQGVIALIGPKTMQYDQTLGIVESFQHEMQRQLTNYHNQLEGLD